MSVILFRCSTCWGVVAVDEGAPWPNLCKVCNPSAAPPAEAFEQIALTEVFAGVVSAYIAAESKTATGGQG